MYQSLRHPHDSDMDLTKVLPSFDRIVGSLARVELYTYGSCVPEASLIEVACWMTDNGLAAFFGLAGSDEGLNPLVDEVKPEDWDADSLQQFAPEFTPEIAAMLARLLDPKEGMKSREIHGGTGPQHVQAMLQSRRALLRTNLK